MAEKTGIAWTDHTFNPWWGCTKVSPGCTNCYAEALDHRTGGDLWGVGKARRRTGARNWNDPVRWNKQAEIAGVRSRVFCASMADWLDDAVPVLWVAELLDLIRRTPMLDWQLLTKRPELWPARMQAVVSAEMAAPVIAVACGKTVARLWLDGVPPRNVWAGTTVEDQRRADERIPHLRAIPALVHFLSCEPLLENVNIARSMWPVHDSWPAKYKTPEEARAAGAVVTRSRQGLVSAHSVFVNWVIVGGESGTDARPFHLAWAHDLVRQCQDAGTACFVKQLGAFPVGHDGEQEILGHNKPVLGSQGRKLVHPHGADPAEWPSALRVREFPSSTDFSYCKRA